MKKTKIIQNAIRITADALSSRHIIFLHGLFGNANNFVPIAQRLHALLNCNCHLLDCRNHGRSSHSVKHDFDVLAEDVRDYMSENSIESASVIGHSMGGKTAMLLSLNFPKLVDALVVADVSPKAYPDLKLHARFLQSLMRLDLNSLKDKKHADKLLAPDIVDKGTRQFLLTNLRRLEEHSKWSWRVNLPVLNEQLPALRSWPLPLDCGQVFEKPVLFIRGRASNYVKDSDVAAIRIYFPNYELKTIDGTHLMHYENPEDFSRTVAQFLSGSVPQQ